MIPLDFQLASYVLSWVAKKMKTTVFDGSTGNDYYIPTFDDTEDIYYTGVVTEIKDNVAFIGSMYSFSITKVDKDVFVGSVVTCVVKRDGNNGQLDQINIIDIFDNRLEDDESAYEDTSRTGISRTGVISAREENIFFVNPGPVHFDINKVKVNFMPEVMDFIKLIVNGRVNQETGEYEEVVLEVSSLGYRKVSGRITWFEDGSGLVDDVISFDYNNCLPGYEPRIDDQVVLSVIRCQRGAIKYRAVDVRPVAYPGVVSVPAFFEEFVLLPKEIIKVDAEVERTVNAVLHNTSGVTYHLKNIIVDAGDNFVELVEPKDFPLTFHAHSKISLIVKVTVKYIGFASVHLVMKLDTHVTQAELRLLAEGSQPTIQDVTGSVKKLAVASLKRGMKTALKSDPEFPIPGRRFRKPLNFVPVKLGTYQVPEVIVCEFRDNGFPTFNDIERCIPCLQDGLKSDNYKIYMHALLYLEEIAYMQKIARLEVTSAFGVKGDFLCLYVDEDSLFRSLLHSGDRVIATTPWSDGAAFEGIIWYFRPGCMMIKFRSEFHAAYVRGAEYRIVFYTGRSTFRLNHQAVDDAVHRFGTKWLFPAEQSFRHQPPLVTLVNAPLDPKLENSLVGKVKKPVWNRHGAGYGRNQRMEEAPSVIPMGRVREARWFNSKLNSEQRHAVEAILKASKRPLPYIIFGPPGTGKSFTLVELILQIYHNIPESRLIVSAPSNSAADVLALSLIGGGFLPEGALMRLCGYHYASSGALPLSLVPVAAMPDINGNGFALHDPQYEEPVDFPLIKRDDLATKRIIVGTVTTLGSLRSMGFPRGFMTHVILDEAAYVPETESLILANMLSDSGVMIMAGDHKQLGPIVFSNFAQRYGLKCSLMERMMSFALYRKDVKSFPDNLGYNPAFVTKLVKSYRSLPAILHVPNKLFYDQDLKSMVDPEKSREAKIYNTIRSLFPPESSIPVLFHSVKGQECTETNSFSYYNLEEAYQVVSFIVRLYQWGIKPADVGIITPYNSQIKQLQKFMSNMNLECPKIGSVEEFQGQERDVIILSTVRTAYGQVDTEDSKEQNPDSVPKKIVSNLHQLLGFVASPNRSNVALTRARAALIVIGDHTALFHDKTWRTFITYCISNKSFIS